MSNPLSTPAVGVPTLIPAAHSIGWRQWVPTGSGDMYGNSKGTHAAARAMPCQGVYQTGTQQPVSLEYATRQVEEVDVLVPDASPYGKKDVVLLGGTALPDGSYSGGKAFVFDGHPQDYTTTSPFSELNGVFGDVLKLKRTG